MMSQCKYNQILRTFSWFGGKKNPTKEKCYITGMIVDHNPFTGTISGIYPIHDSKKFTLDQIKSGEAKRVLIERIKSNEENTKRRITKVERIKYHGTNKSSRDKELDILIHIKHDE